MTLNRKDEARPKRSILRQIKDGLRGFASAASGNVAMIYALALIPAMGAAGAAIDLG